MIVVCPMFAYNDKYMFDFAARSNH
jgi:hypothetical protein